jgi:exodeoxyribonuclease VII large subunit
MAGIYSVSQVNAYIRNLFSEDFMLRRIRVRGELSNVKYHSSGHIYFTIKDSGGTLSAVMFASQRKGLSFTMREGQKIVVTGSIEVYERAGTYQIYATSIEEEGRGDLYEEFLKRKERLEEMGMFSEQYKQPIPKYAQKIGIVTASTGAAVHDIINIATRRNPYVQLILCPALVQGDSASASIVRGLQRLDAYGADVIIVGRGGGSIEDLWAFNEENVARAIFDCRTPVISAVGHETDFTIADFVADLRAPTPSAAAELAVMDYQRFSEDLEGRRDALRSLMEDKISACREKANQLELRLQVKSPGARLRENRAHAESLRLSLVHAMQNREKDRKQSFLLLAEKLHQLSPLNRLKGGFSYVTGADGKAVREAGSVKKGEELRLRFKDGSVRTEVREVLLDGKNERSGS